MTRDPGRPEVGRFSPNHIELPTLSIRPDHSELLFQAGMNRFIARATADDGALADPDFKSAALGIALARLCDKALDDWWGVEEAVAAHTARRHDPSIFWFMIATSRMEGFINALHRGLVVAESIRRRRHSVSISKGDLPAREDQARLRSIRDQIEHMDKRIRAGVIQPGDPTMVLMNVGSVELGDVEIAYDELAWWVCQVSDVATRARTHIEQTCALRRIPNRSNFMYE